MLFEPIPLDNFEILNTTGADDDELLLGLDGTPRASTWKPMKVVRQRADSRKKMQESDFPWLVSCALAMRKRAVEALRALLEPNGEVLPLAADDGAELFVFNTRAIDALDEEKSVLWRFPNSGQIMRVKKAVLRKSAVQGVDIFRLPYRSSTTYVSDRFIDVVQRAGLVGLRFDKVSVG